jgi:hypothetical protein
MYNYYILSVDNLESSYFTLSYFNFRHRFSIISCPTNLFWYLLFLCLFHMCSVLCIFLLFVTWLFT